MVRMSTSKPPPIWAETSVARLGDSLRRLINHLLSINAISSDVEVQIERFSDAADRLGENLAQRAPSKQLPSDQINIKPPASGEVGIEK